MWKTFVISHTLDGRLIATDKETGQAAWQRQVAEPDKREVITGAPLVADQWSHACYRTKLFRRTDQDMKSFVDETRSTITQTEG